MAKKTSLIPPLKRVIDYKKWEAEGLLGRLVITAHAAFLDSGFVTCGRPWRRSLPIQWAATASTLSLEYTVPALEHHVHAIDAEAAVMKICAVGNCVVLYAYLNGGLGPPIIRWCCLDVPKLVPLQTLDLDAMCVALEKGASGLWKEVKGRLCSPLFADFPLPPCFMCLPADLKLKILKLLSRADVKRVARTCSELRDLCRSNFGNEKSKLGYPCLFTWSWDDELVYVMPDIIHNMRKLQSLINISTTEQGADAGEQKQKVERAACHGEANLSRHKTLCRATSVQKWPRNSGAIHSPSSRHRWSHR